MPTDRKPIGERQTTDQIRLVLWLGRQSIHMILSSSGADDDHADPCRILPPPSTHDSMTKLILRRIAFVLSASLWSYSCSAHRSGSGARNWAHPYQTLSSRFSSGLVQSMPKHGIGITGNATLVMMGSVDCDLIYQVDEAALVSFDRLTEFSGLISGLAIEAPLSRFRGLRLNLPPPLPASGPLLPAIKPHICCIESTSSARLLSSPQTV